MVIPSFIEGCSIKRNQKFVRSCHIESQTKVNQNKNCLPLYWGIAWKINLIKSYHRVISKGFRKYRKKHKRKNQKEQLKYLFFWPTAVKV